MKRIHLLILGAILVIAAILRLWQIGQVPPSPDWDEASLGYNAYSILETGRDEYGTFLPVVLRSFDDYKPPLYAYLATVPIALFGLDTWVVRLPSAIFGIFAVWGCYELAYLLFRKREIAFLSSFLLAISPWHIQFSRIAFEANIGLTLNIWSFVFFFKSFVRPKWLLASAFASGLAIYAYHSERLFLPLLLLIAGWIYRKELLSHKKIFFYAILVGALTIAPLSRVLFDRDTLMRLRGTSSLADQTGLLARSVKKLEEDRKKGNLWGPVFDNRRLVWFKTVAEGYLSHYSFKWLFLTGDNPRHHAPDMGLLYLWELPFLLWGIYVVFCQKDKSKLFLLSWFIVAPLAASPTTELPHAIRSLVFLPTFQLFTASGIFQFVLWVKYRKNMTKQMTATVVVIAAILNVIYYLHMYFGHLNSEVSEYWQYGYKQAVSYAQSHASQYKKIIVSTKLEQPYMFFLFYLHYDPAKYLAEGGTASGGFAEKRNHFDVYQFRPIDWSKEVKDGSTLYIGSPSEIVSTPLNTIYYLDGTEAMRIADR